MLNDIQVLRAFAALNVALFQILGSSAAQGLAPHSLLFLQGWGECGVDIFFAISGFVMVVAHSGKDVSPIDFMVLRIHHIVPVYWLLTLLVIAAYALMPQLAKSAPPSISHIAASFFFLSGALLGKPPVLYVGWTLEYEMLFYLLFALSRCTPHPIWRVLLQVAGMVLAVFWGGANAVLTEFLLGVLAGELFLRQTLRAYAPMIAMTGLALLCTSIFFKPDWSRIIIWGLPSLMIVWGAAASRQIDGGMFTYLGATAYSIYLVQVISLPAFYRLATHIPGLVPNELLALVALLIATLSGCLFHEYCEKPITAWLKAQRTSIRLQPR